MRTPEPLKLLLMRAGFGPTDYTCRLYRLDECVLASNQLLCPDLASRNQIERLFGEGLRRVMPDLQTRIMTSTPTNTKAMPPSVLKKATPQKFWS